MRDIDMNGSDPVATSPVGIMHQMWALAGQSDADFLRDTVEDVQLADELGFHSIWLAEHHYVRPDSFYSRLPDPEILIARLIPETSRIRLATGIKILVLDDPSRTIERLRLLDLLSGHRVLLGVGQGSPDELAVTGVAPEERRAGFRARLIDLAALLTSGTGAGGRNLTPDADLRPLETMWVGVRDVESIALTASLGMNFIVGEAEVGRRQSALVQAFRDAGGTGEARGARLVCVAETDEEAMAAASAPGRVLYDRFRQGVYHADAVRLGLLPETEAADDAEAFRRLEYIVGSPATVVDGLSEYIEATGVDALNVLVHTPGMERRAARRSLTLLREEVVDLLVPALDRNAAPKGARAPLASPVGTRT